MYVHYAMGRRYVVPERPLEPPDIWAGYDRRGTEYASMQVRRDREDREAQELDEEPEGTP